MVILVSRFRSSQIPCGILSCELRNQKDTRAYTARVSAAEARGRHHMSPIPSLLEGYARKCEGDFSCRANNQNPPTTVPTLPGRMEPSSIKQPASPALVQEMGQKRPLPGTKPRAGRESIGLITRPRS